MKEAAHVKEEDGDEFERQVDDVHSQNVCHWAHHRILTLL